MKKTLLLLSIVALVYSCKKQESLPPNTYEITVTAKGVINGLRSYIKLIDQKKKEIIIDTAIVMNETFTFTGKVSGPSIRVLSINSIKGSLPFVLEPGRTTIEIYKDNIYSSKIDGSSNNSEYNLFKTNYKEKLNAISEIKKLAGDARQNEDRTQLEELRAKDRTLSAALNGYAHEFIGEHPNSDLSLLLLESQMIGGNQSIDEFKNSMTVLKKVLSRNVFNKGIGKKIEAFIYRLEAQKNLEIGMVAPNFTSTTPNGEKLVLNDIKGKATIIDFWASWCRPCRIENPNVVRVYEKYHDKGLEIISVSLDKAGQKERWLKAIEDDKMNWHHVSNLKFWNEPVARLYRVNSIPATFILDKDGKIVAKRLRGNALEQKIAELLD